MRKLIPFLLLVAFFSCKKEPVQQNISLIPQPQNIKILDENFKINKNTSIAFDQHYNELQKVADYFQAEIEKRLNLDLKINHEIDSDKKNTIQLVIDTTISINKEAYELTISKNQVLIKAPAANGAFYGIQTVLQLMNPTKINEQISFSNKLPCVQISDFPRFKWRGMHLDVCRHFYDKDFVKKYIDLIALHKMNTFHWHLTDDQGWRIEIKKYPKLTEIGSYRPETMVGKNWDEFDGTPHNGFFTQEDIKEIVEYAAERFITIVPEIEMPGHALAALAAYPQFGCTGGPYEVAKTWGVFDDVFCAGNDSTFKFLEDVLSEVIELFPGKYIHVGGDECPKGSWEKCPKCQKRIKDEGLKDEFELQSYFIKRIENFLISKNKKLIGWDEILEGGLAPEATVMSWRGTEGGIHAAKMDHDVVMSPNDECYFDHYQANPENEPLAIGGYTDLKDVYNYDPVPTELNEQDAKHILGAQANLWTEYITAPEHVEYMVLPRMCALSDVVWSNPQNKNYEDFLTRLNKHLIRLEFEKYNYRKP